MNILYQDQQIMIINKPAGLSVLPDGWEKDSEYLVKMLEEQFGNPSARPTLASGASVGQSGPRIFIVHRFDQRCLLVPLNYPETRLGRFPMFVIHHCSMLVSHVRS